MLGGDEHACRHRARRGGTHAADRGRTPAGAGVRARFDAAALVLPAGIEDRAFGRTSSCADRVRNFAGVKVRG